MIRLPLTEKLLRSITETQKVLAERHYKHEGVIEIPASDSALSLNLPLVGDIKFVLQSGQRSTFGGLVRCSLLLVLLLLLLFAVVVAVVAVFGVVVVVVVVVVGGGGGGGGGGGPAASIAASTASPRQADTSPGAVTRRQNPERSAHSGSTLASSRPGRPRCTRRRST